MISSSNQTKRTSKPSWLGDHLCRLLSIIRHHPYQKYAQDNVVVRRDGGGLIVNRFREGKARIVFVVCSLKYIWALTILEKTRKILTEFKTHQIRNSTQPDIIFHPVFSGAGLHQRFSQRSQYFLLKNPELEWMGKYKCSELEWHSHLHRCQVDSSPMKR